MLIFFLIQSTWGYCKHLTVTSAVSHKNAWGKLVDVRRNNLKRSGFLHYHLVWCGAIFSSSCSIGFLCIWCDVYFSHDLWPWIAVPRAVQRGWWGEIWSWMQMLFFIHLHTRKIHEQKMLFNPPFLWKWNTTHVKNLITVCVYFQISKSTTILSLFLCLLIVCLRM